MMRWLRGSLLFPCLWTLLCCLSDAWQLTDPSFHDAQVDTNSSVQQVRDNEFAEKQQGGITDVCAYRVLDRGEEGRLCFRHTWIEFTCPSSTCRQVRSSGGHLVANLLSNSTVLLQWAYPMALGRSGQFLEEVPPKSSRRTEKWEPQGGFRMSCWWNGSYTQFECASVHLASSCTDYLLTELHENVPYRICLKPVVWDGPGECVEFSVTPSGMRDIVIAMMTVGGAICVMLVIICLLVAYITENIMSSSVQHALAAQHSRRSHNTYL